MKMIRLNRNYVAFMDDEDWEIWGYYTWTVDRRPHTAYAVNGTYGRLHVVIMKPPEGLDVSHLDGNGLNCTRANMKITNRRENIRATISKTTLIGFQRTRNGRWTARLRYPDGTRPSLGVFDSKEEAARAYHEAVKRVYGN